MERTLWSPALQPMDDDDDDDYSFPKTRGNENKQCTHSTRLNKIPFAVNVRGAFSIQWSYIVHVINYNQGQDGHMSQTGPKKCFIPQNCEKTTNFD